MAKRTEKPLAEQIEAMPSEDFLTQKTEDLHKLRILVYGMHLEFQKLKTEFSNMLAEMVGRPLTSSAEIFFFSAMVKEFGPDTAIESLVYASERLDMEAKLLNVMKYAQATARNWKHEGK